MMQNKGLQHSSLAFDKASFVATLNGSRQRRKGFEPGNPGDIFIWITTLQSLHEKSVEKLRLVCHGRKPLVLISDGV